MSCGGSRRPGSPPLWSFKGSRLAGKRKKAGDGLEEGDVLAKVHVLGQERTVDTHGCCIVAFG